MPCPAEEPSEAQAGSEILAVEVEMNPQVAMVESDAMVVDTATAPLVKKEPQEISVPTASRKRRYFMDYVFLQTLDSISSKRRRVMKDESPIKPKKIKKIERSAGLGEGTLQKRLTSAGISLEPRSITLSADTRYVSTRRDFMSITFGGNRQSTFPSIARESYTRTGHRYLMYPSLVQNPDAPMIPGAPGLFLNASGWPARESNAKWANGTYNLKVLTRLAAHDFLYMGEYAIRPSDSLTQAEWNLQPQNMRTRWCSKLAKKDWGRMTRCRITLRARHERNPTRKEVEKAMKTKRKFSHITADDIAKAFNSGEERLAVWTMKCVGYDEQFQRDIVRQMTGWVPPPPKTPQAKKAKKTTPAKKKQVKGRGKRAVVESENESIGIESEDESDIK
ncbi:hypothetical protein C8R46DRAFT_90093 [Mycena filopes]|nr:hypothetical protein C8R46DRAFT_90093 [Mycena filopes]